MLRRSLDPGVVGLLQVGFLSTETSDTLDTSETTETTETLETNAVPPYGRHNHRASRLVGASACLRPGVMGLLQLGFLSTGTTETSETSETLETTETSVIPQGHPSLPDRLRFALRLAESPPDSLATQGPIHPQPRPVPLHLAWPTTPLVYPLRRRLMVGWSPEM